MVAVISTSFSGFLYCLGFGGGNCRRSYGVVASPEQTVTRSESTDYPARVDDEIEKIRQDFVAAKESFLRIPEALKEMPKMNPEGL